MMIPHASPRLVRASVLLGWLLLMAFAVRAAMLGRIGADVRSFQIAYGLGFVGYALLVWVVLRSDSRTPIGSWWMWLIGCAVLRLTVAGMLPSDDTYRYLWEGRVQLEGFNPYIHAPASPQLEGLRDETWNKINHPDYPAIYGPVAELEFLAATAARSGVLSIKALHALWDILTIVVLGATLRRAAHCPHRAFVYGLCPLVLTAFAIEGHVDSLMLMFLAMVAWAAGARRFSLAGAALGLAIGAKIVAVVLLPWFAVRRPKAFLIAIGVIAACYLPYASAGRELFASLTRFGGGEFFSLLDTFGILSYEFSKDRVISGIILLTVLVFSAWKKNELTQYASRSLGALILLMPVVHYWYVCWVMLFGLARVRFAWLAFAGAAVLYFNANIPQEAGGEWIMPPWVPFVVWGCFLGTWLCELVVENRERNRRNTGQT